MQSSIAKLIDANDQLELRIFKQRQPPELAKSDIIYLLDSIVNQQQVDELDHDEIDRIFRAWKLFLMSRLKTVYEKDLYR